MGIQKLLRMVKKILGWTRPHKTLETSTSAGGLKREKKPWKYGNFYKNKNKKIKNPTKILLIININKILHWSWQG